MHRLSWRDCMRKIEAACPEACWPHSATLMDLFSFACTFYIPACADMLTGSRPQGQQLLPRKAMCLQGSPLPFYGFATCTLSAYIAHTHTHTQSMRKRSVKIPDGHHVWFCNIHSQQSFPLPAGIPPGCRGQAAGKPGGERG